MRTNRRSTSFVSGICVALLITLCLRTASVRGEDARPAARQQLSASQILSRALNTWADLIEPAEGATPRTLSGTVTVAKAAGLPNELSGARVKFALQAPDRLNLTATVEGKQYRAGRDGQQAWAG